MRYLRYLGVAILILSGTKAYAVTAAQLVRGNFDYMRDKASVSEVEMTVHRPDWERTTTLKVWTRGEKDSLFTVVSPAMDRGNGTLKRGREMWMYNPKINRTIKLPPSMMSQAWMGSDFSNNDLAKSDTVINDYTHRITGTEVRDGKTIYHIESIPKPEAPVVWGKITISIRDDLIPLKETFFDEDMKPVKTLTFSDLAIIGGKLYPRVMTMQKADHPGEYTRVVYLSLAFKKSLPDRYFTLSALESLQR